MNPREVTILISIVLVDLVAKLLANYLLPYGEPVNAIGDQVRFYLVYNEGAANSRVDYMMGGEVNMNLMVIMSCTVGLTMIGYVWLVRKKPGRLVWKILAGLGLYVVLSTVAAVVLLAESNINVSTWATSVFAKASGALVFGTIFWLATNAWIRLSALLMVSAGLGNLLSHFYPPYKVVDFIHIEGTYELLRIGIFNVADVGAELGLVGLIVSSIVAGARMAWKGINRSDAEAQRFR